MAEKPTSTSSADYEVLKRSKIVQWAAKDALLTEKIRRQEAQQSKGPKLFGKKIKVVMPFPMTLLLWRILPYMCGVVVLAVVFIGFYFREKAYFSAGEGAGYALGVVGTCMICALFLYPLRKRVPMMKRLGDVKIWFGFHMLCGVLGPVVILFHANFSLGPVKSTIALLTMVIVIVSGVVGHYLYMRTHDGLYGPEADLSQMEERLHHKQQEIEELLHLGAEVKAEIFEFSHHIMAFDKGLTHSGLKILTLGIRTGLIISKIRKAVRRDLCKRVETADCSPQEMTTRVALIVREARDFLQQARMLVRCRFYGRLFPIWHVLHMGLVVMLMLTIIIHVSAVYGASA